MTKPKSLPKHLKIGRPAYGDLEVYIAAEATSRVSGLSINALSTCYSQLVIYHGRSPREWPVIQGKGISKRHSRVNAEIIRLPKEMAKRGAPEHLQRAMATIDRLVGEYTAAQGPEWAITVKAQGEAIRKLRARQYRRAGVRNVKPKKPTPDG